MFFARPTLTIVIPDKSMEEQIIELESRIAFQEEAIHSLSETVALQQQRIEALASMLARMREKLSALEPSPMQGDEAEPPPPHY